MRMIVSDVDRRNFDAYDIKFVLEKILRIVRCRMRKKVIGIH